MRHPLGALYREHRIILSAVSHLQQWLQSDGGQTGWQEIGEGYIQFFREYGDDYHHGKEENILFPKLKSAAPDLAMGILDELEDHHSQFREALAKAEDCIQNNHWEGFSKILKKYSEDLKDHIAAEDDELFVSAEEILSVQELGRIPGAFEDWDRNLGEEVKSEWETQWEA